MTIRKVMMATMCVAGVAMPVAAQTQAGIEGRVGKLESEMRAVQRKVFPGGSGMTVEPQITAPTTPVDNPGTPSGGAITDLTARVSALESSVRSVTGQVEQANYRVRQLEEAFAAYKTATDARLKAVEPETGAAVVGDTAPAVDGPPQTHPTRPTSTRPDPARPVTTPASPADPERVAAVQAIEKPKTADPAEDGYVYGFRLWQAKFYPEAEKELKAVADKYPKHRRASFSQNLLGRAYLDEGKPSLASIAFYDSYKKFPDGERAADSLQYLAKSLISLKKYPDACKVYGELNAVFGDKLSAAVKADVAKGQATAKCG